MTPQETRIRGWLVKNWGVLTVVAKQCGVTSQYVQAIAYGKRKHTKVEATLRSKGWPGVKKGVMNGDV